MCKFNSYTNYNVMQAVSVDIYFSRNFLGRSEYKALLLKRISLKFKLHYYNFLDLEVFVYCVLRIFFWKN